MSAPKGRGEAHAPLWQQAMMRWTDDEREAFEHLAAKFQYEAPDVYPTKYDAEKAAFNDIAARRIQ